MDTKTKEEMESQQYRFAGSHSAVKVCGWTKNMIRGRGGCYKLKFYGIMSHQCLQMTTCLSCANRCLFCWRGHKEPVAKEWQGDVDEPDLILTRSIEAHIKLLQGFGGNENADKKVLEQSQTVRHVALSLTGEPLIYPKLNEFLALCNKQNISTFMVTNGQYPKHLADMDQVTQLYISLDGPNEEVWKKIDVPLFKDSWDRMLQSLDLMSTRKDRTCIRITLLKDMNMIEPEGYAKLIERGSPDFVEVKGYMFVGASRQILDKSNMPYHEDVVEFTKDLIQYLDDYEIVSEHIPSRVILLAKKKFKINNKWMSWIDFKKWHNLVNSDKDFSTEDYLLPTPETGLSGKGTKDKIEKDECELD